MINPVMLNRRKSGCDAVPKWQAARWRRLGIAPLSSVVRPGNSDPLQASLIVNHTELGKPDHPHRARFSVVSRPQGRGTGERVKEAGESEGSTVMVGIGPSRGGNTHSERRQTSGWSRLERNSWRARNRG